MNLSINLQITTWVVQSHGLLFFFGGAFHEAVFREMLEVDTYCVCVSFFLGGFVYFNHGQKTQTSNKTGKIKKVDQVSL